MSRIGKQPIDVPSGVKITLEPRSATIEGQNGKLSIPIPEGITVSNEANQLIVARTDETRQQRALHGLIRALLANMIEGVTKGFVKELEIVGVGYRAQVQGNTLNLQLGYSHPINFTIPEGIETELPKQTHIIIKGPDKQVVGDFAARIRTSCKPEPYKGKGIRYLNEQIRRKSGKAVA